MVRRAPSNSTGMNWVIRAKDTNFLILHGAKKQPALMSIRQEIRTHSRMWVKMVRRAPSNSQSTGSSHEWRTLTYQLEPSETTA